MDVKKKNTPSIDQNEQKVEEPATAFKTFRVFNSFEEENEYTCRSYAQLTPEERLATVTQMRLTAHPYLGQKTRPWGKRIYFDSE